MYYIMTRNKSNEIVESIRLNADERQAQILLRFFKSDKGQYGEGDVFLGVKVPVIRKLVAQHGVRDLDVLDRLLREPYHEVRTFAIISLCQAYAKASDDNGRKMYYDFYMSHTPYINNWDLVDISCCRIVGDWLLRDQSLAMRELDRLASSTDLWEQRIAIVSTQAFIRQRIFDHTIRICTALLYHPHDLIRKAIGWTLREMGKKDIQLLYDFLDSYAGTMPRVTLRYAIEKMPADQRKYYMQFKSSYLVKDIDG